MGTAYLLLGSNLGDRQGHLAFARDRIREDFPSSRFSSLYETEPVGIQGAAWFLNQAAEVITGMTPDSLLQWAHRLENDRGRVRAGTGPAPRTLDVDLLLYDDRVVASPSLILPHPRLLQRRFALAPLNDLAPGARVPPSGITVREALSRLSFREDVRPLT